MDHHHAEADPQPEFEQLLRAADLRVTRPRLAVLRALGRHPHADTGSVLAAVRTEQPTVSHQAVYDVLVGDNHHHVVCRACGAVADVDCAVGVRPCLDASDAHGFVIDEAEVTYWGVCPDCATTPATTPATHN